MPSDVLSELVRQLPPDVSKSILQVVRAERRSTPAPLPRPRTAGQAMIRDRIQAHRDQRARAQALGEILVAEARVQAQKSISQIHRRRELSDLLATGDQIESQDRARVQEAARIRTEVEQTRINSERDTRARRRTAWEDTIDAIPVGSMPEEYMTPSWMVPFEQTLGYRW